MVDGAGPGKGVARRVENSKALRGGAWNGLPRPGLVWRREARQGKMNMHQFDQNNGLRRVRLGEAGLGRAGRGPAGQAKEPTDAQ